MRMGLIVINQKKHIYIPNLTHICSYATFHSELKWILDWPMHIPAPLCGTSPFPVPEQLTLAPGELGVDVSSVPVRSYDEATCGSASLESKARLRSLVVPSFLTFVPSLARFWSTALMLLLSAVCTFLQWHFKPIRRTSSSPCDPRSMPDCGRPSFLTSLWAGWLAGSLRKSKCFYVVQRNLEPQCEQGEGGFQGGGQKCSLITVNRWKSCKSRHLNICFVGFFGICVIQVSNSWLYPLPTDRKGINKVASSFISAE